MPNLTKTELLTRVLDSIRAVGWNVIRIRDRHPYDLTIFNKEMSYQVRLYVWNVTHGGGAARAPTEYRIQVTGVALPLVAPQGYQTLLFGWYEQLRVIAAFDPDRHRQPSAASPSIQISISTLQEAAARGLAVQQRGNREIALAFRPELLTTYIENQRSLHDFAGSSHDIELLERAGRGQEVQEEETRSIPTERERVILTISIRRREASFRARVLSAYNHSCAMCYLQLDLVETAHIIPVGVPGSTDETRNGLALCPLHHEAYDDALVGIRPDYRVIVNERLLRNLRAEQRHRGEARFRAALKERIMIPVLSSDRPDPDYLRIALQIRRW
jgi:putative restriction endonuclease